MKDDEEQPMIEGEGEAKDGVGAQEEADEKEQPEAAEAASGSNSEADADEHDETEAITEGEDDPLAQESFDLEGGERLDRGAQGAGLPFDSRVNDLEVFFQEEALYRFDLLEVEEREMIRGSYCIEVEGKPDACWVLTLAEEIEVSKDKKDVDTTLKASEKDLLEVVNGDLNPQLAIAAKKILVKGDLKRAVAIQTLLSPVVD